MEENTKISVAGNKGDKTRSDCQITLELKSTGGLQVEVVSKVKSMYGKSIERLCIKGLQFFDIEHAHVLVEDFGALDFVIMARLEYAIKQLKSSNKEFLPEKSGSILINTTKSLYRFTRLYLPGNSPSYMLNAGIHKPDGVILDLEDSVAPTKKAEARYLVRNALRAVDFYGAERMVRINQGAMGVEDLAYIIPHHVNLILVPKCESADTIRQLDVAINKLKRETETDNITYFMPIIESALGVENAFSIATSSENIVALALGLEDFTADLGVKRTQEGTESLYARTRLVNACKAAGIQAIDSVFSNVANLDALAANVRTSKGLGFEGMGCIHPRQIPVIKKEFAPDAEEIEKAKQIVIAYREAIKKGLGVVSLGSKMIDAPVVKRAEKTIQLAEKLNLIPSDWEIKINS